MYDDIANSASNPYKGQIYNNYAHEDVYAGVPKDYTGSAVDPDVFLKVITGQAPGVGSNKYLQSNENDRVFIFFDVCCCFLSLSHFISQFLISFITLMMMMMMTLFFSHSTTFTIHHSNTQKNNQTNRIMVVMEFLDSLKPICIMILLHKHCRAWQTRNSLERWSSTSKHVMLAQCNFSFIHSHSFFNSPKQLNNNNNNNNNRFYDLTLPKNMYVVTASPITSSSFAWQYDSKIGTYLADVMAQSWVNQTVTAPEDGFLFQEGYEYLTTHIDNGSQPCQYGDLKLAQEVNINDFFGAQKTSETKRVAVGNKRADKSSGAVASFDASYEAAKLRVLSNPSMENVVALKFEEAVRQRVDNALHNILVASGLENGANQIETPCPSCDATKCKCLQECGTSAECKFECCNLESCHKRYSLSLNGDACSQTLVGSWQKTCGNFNDYLRVGDGVLSRACRLRSGDKMNVEAALQAISKECPLDI